MSTFPCTAVLTAGSADDALYDTHCAANAFSTASMHGNARHDEILSAQLWQFIFHMSVLVFTTAY
tara:strand:+ start:525 stop:719 length:195 start_codon:yes stop_codon:yes gene_type:complete